MGSVSKSMVDALPPSSERHSAPNGLAEVCQLYLLCSCMYLMKPNSMNVSWYCRDWWNRRPLFVDSGFATAVDVSAVFKKKKKREYIPL